MLRWVLALCLAAGPLSAQVGRLTANVDPFIGTGGHGHTFPGPSLPFGLVQLSPDTRLTGWDGCSGYHYSDSRIYGFSHTHLSGTGASDYGDVLVMPTTGELRWNNGADGKPGYAAAFDHSREQAAPGYYAVALLDSGVRAELTATLRVGMHRYTFPRGRPGRVIFDLEHRDEVLDASLRFVSDREIEGSRRSKHWAADQRLFFVARFSRPFVFRGIAVEGRLQPDIAEARGKSLKAFAGFGDEGGEVLVKVAISAVSIEGARRNLEIELPGWDFDAVRRAAGAAWERELSKIVVEGGSRQQQRTFYTALYHAFLAPNLYMDVDGQYRGRDLEVHRAEGFRYHTVFSLWDTFRAEHPLLTILDRRRTADFIQTFLRQYREGGRLPVWELSSNETDCMIGYHAVPVIADAILKGIGGFDVELAFEAMVHSAEEERYGVGALKRDGFIGADQESESVSRTLEYAYDDWCIAQVARRLGKSPEYERYIRRAQAYKHLFDPSGGFMRARMDGHWFAPFDPAEVNFNYTEGNAWQYSFFVPQDVDGLMKLLGGLDAFVRKLDLLFSTESQLAGNQLVDITGMVGQYAHGNEPSHHMAYLYSFAGQPRKTQAMVRRLLDTMYFDKPDGLIGNEDCGQMSAWYVLSALGFYSVTPGSNQYVIGTPLFPKASIRLENGRSFVIRAPAVSGKAFFIRSATLNSRPWTKAYLEHVDVASGGQLVLAMSEAPSETWGRGPGDLPRTAITESLVLPAPFVATGAPVFRGAAEVSLGDAEPDCEIHFTLDGSEPSASSPRYEGAIRITQDATLRAIALAPGFSASPALSAFFHRVPLGRSIQLFAKYSRQYAAGGDDALIDGLRGGVDFRRGRWQGYQGQDLTAVVDLGSEREIHRLAMGFLQDAGSWIFMPRRVLFAISSDGVHFTEVGEVVSGVPDRETKVVTKDLAITIAPRKARYVRARVESYGKLPPWHAGAGEPSFFFADEILID